MRYVWVMLLVAACAEQSTFAECEVYECNETDQCALVYSEVVSSEEECNEVIADVRAALEEEGDEE